MLRIPVSSTNIKAVGYDRGVLEIEFHNGSIYQYDNVPVSVHDDFMRSSSKGNFVHKHLKYKYTTTRVR